MIRTERLLLRRWQESDREPFAALNADPVVVELLQGPMSRERSDDFVDRIERHWDAHGWGLWAVEVRERAPFIGYVGLWPAGYVGEGMVEVGWRLAAEHWGHGYATEAAREALRFGFEEVGLHQTLTQGPCQASGTRASVRPVPRTTYWASRNARAVTVVSCVVVASSSNMSVQLRPSKLCQMRPGSRASSGASAAVRPLRSTEMAVNPSAAEPS